MSKHDDKVQKNHFVEQKKERSFRDRMNSVHNKMSRGAEQFWATLKRRMSFGQKGHGNTHNKSKNNTLNRPK
jgi:hypothetical protein